MYRLVIVLALFLIALRLAGVASAVLAGLVAVVLLSRDLMWAYATYGALAFGLLGIALTVWSVTATRSRWRTIGLVLGGVAGGAAVLIRFDFVPAVILGCLPLLILVPSRSRWWFAAGFAGATALYVLHIALVGRTSRRCCE